MNDEIIDADQMNPDTWDSKKRVAVSDAIIEVNDHVKKVKYGRYFLFALAAFNLLFVVMVLATSNSMPEGILYPIIGFITILLLPFLVFGILYPRNPLLFLVLGLVLYLVSLGVSVAMFGGNLTDGYARKVGVLAVFGFAIYSVFRWKSNMDKLKALGYSSSALTRARKNLSPLPRLRKKKKQE